MTVALFSHPACLDHDTGPWHPESAERLRRVLAALDGEKFSALTRRDSPRATHEQLARVHDEQYLAAIMHLKPPAGTRRALDGGDTLVSSGSVEAALRAAGGAVAAVDSVVGGTARAAFVATRPPGHHAEKARAMGFCLFASAAMAARHAMVHWGLERVAVVDLMSITATARRMRPGRSRDSSTRLRIRIPAFPELDIRRNTGNRTMS